MTHFSAAVTAAAHCRLSSIYIDWSLPIWLFALFSQRFSAYLESIKSLVKTWPGGVSAQGQTSRRYWDEVSARASLFRLVDAIVDDLGGYVRTESSVLI